MNQKLMKGIWISFWMALLPMLSAQVPQLLHYQGRVAVNNVNFNGLGQFKFALVSANGATTYWSHDGSSVNGGGRRPV